MLYPALSLSLVLLSGSVLAVPAPLAIDAASRFTYYNSLTPLAGPCDLATGPDGAIWGQNILADIITRVDPKTGKVEEYNIPYETATDAGLIRSLEPQRLALACAIRDGADGNLYAASGVRSQFLRINPQTKKIKVYTPPLPNTAAGNLEPFNDLWTDDKGMYFTLTTANVFFYFEYATETFTPYPMPKALSGPLGVYKASDGNFYICEFLGNRIAQFNPHTRQFTKEWDLPLPLGAGPAVVRAESPAGTVWFTNFIGQSMGSLNFNTGEVRIIADPGLAGFPTEDTVDSEGNIWYSTALRNTLNKLNVTTGEVTTIRQPTLGLVAPISLPPAVNIASHYGPGNAIWFTEVANNRIGRYQL